MKFRHFPILLGLLLVVSSTFAQGVVYNESIDGELSDSGPSPTVVTFGIGLNTIQGSLGSGGGGGATNGNDADIFTFTLAPGQAVDSISTTRTAYGSGFIGYANAASLAEITGSYSLQAAIDAGALFNNGSVSGATTGGLNPIPALLTEGSHTFFLQEASTPTDFSISFNVVQVDPDANPPLPEGPVVFDFRSTNGNGVFGADEDGADFDPSSAGDTITVDGLVVTVVDVTAPQYDLSGPLPVETGVILSSAVGDMVVTNISSSQEALGIQNPSISNGDFDLIGNGGESSDLNPGETLTITFDHAVRFTAIELESVIDQDSFDVLVDGELILETTGDNGFIDDLGDLTSLTIAAGSEITFAVDGVLETATGGPATSLRIETFTVEIVPELPAPLLGDVNLDDTVNFLDISPFVARLSMQEFQAEADCNEDGSISFLDISFFISILSGR